MDLFIALKNSQVEFITEETVIARLAAICGVEECQRVTRLEGDNFQSIALSGPRQQVHLIATGVKKQLAKSDIRKGVETNTFVMQKSRSVVCIENSVDSNFMRTGPHRPVTENLAIAGQQVQSTYRAVCSILGMKPIYG